MSNLKATIKNVKSINSFLLEIPLDAGIYAFVGLNGSGKSTILGALSLLLRKKYPPIFPHNALSEIEFEYGADKNILKQGRKSIWWNLSKRNFVFYGMYEGSLFYGTRFNDSTIIDSLIDQNKIDSENIVPAYDYVKEKLSYILHGEPGHYDELYKLINRNFARDLKIKNIPYFYKYDNKFISQYKMSSGECLLISLLHYIYNVFVNKSVPEDQKVLILIDEIELALHPAAVARLYSLFEELLQQHSNLVIYLTSHSPEVIKELPPNHIFLLERNYSTNEIHLVTPCYHHYAIRSLHEPAGYDNLILVEDNLAKKIIEKIIIQEALNTSKLIKVVPVGGWKNVLQLQDILLQSKAFDKRTKICSVLDGDVKEEARKEFKECPKQFLPIPSLEKFLFKNLIQNMNYSFKKKINDKYFTIESIDKVISSFRTKYTTFDDGANKVFYDMLIKKLPFDMSEDMFVSNVCDDILENIDISKFISNIKSLIES